MNWYIVAARKYLIIRPYSTLIVFQWQSKAVDPVDQSLG